MKIQALDPHHYLAVLSPKEAHSLGISFSAGKNQAAFTLRDRLAAAHIFSEISRQYGIHVKKSRILLRLSRIPSGETLLLFSLISQNRHILLPAQKGRWGVFAFCRAEDLFRGARLLFHHFPQCPAWLYQWPPNGWRLVLCASLKDFPSLRCRLGEYAPFCGGALSAAFTREHGILLCEQAVQQLQPFFTD